MRELLRRHVAIGLVLCAVAAGCGDEQAAEADGSDVTASITTLAATETTTATDPGPPLSPSAAGFDTGALSTGLDLLAATDSNAHRIVVSRDSSTALDISLWPSSDDAPHDLASLTKSIVSVVVGTALHRGDLTSIDTPVGEVLTLPDDSPVTSVSLRDLLRMRAGLDCSLEGGEPRLKEMLVSPDFVSAAAALPAAGTPGDTFAYCSPGYHLVSAAMTELTGMSLADYADEALFAPLGIDDFAWEADAQGITHGWGDLALRATDAALIGDLVAADGEWRGERLLPVGFVDELRTAGPTDDATLDYGMGWWLPTDLGDGVLEGIGRGGQELLVMPADGLVVVVTGAQADGRLIARTITAAQDPSTVPSPDADAMIAAAVEQLASSPELTEATAPATPLPIETTFATGPNPLGIGSVGVAQSTAEMVTVTLTIGDTLHQLPVALDGAGTVVTDTPTGAPVHLTGIWDGDRLVVDYEEVFGPEHWTIKLDLEAGLVMTVIDLGEGFPPITITPLP